MFEKNPEEALTLMRGEMRVRRGSLSPLLQGVIYENPYFRMTPSAFEFETPGGAKFRYDRGKELVLDCPDASLEAECDLYQWGTVYGAVAWFNGLLPLHASCIVKDGRSIAFTARSGAGKSTLAASLAVNGWSLLCDDTLVLAELDQGFCALPDGKPMKVTKEMGQLLRLDLGEPVPFSDGKFYVEPTSRANGVTPLRDLVLLEEGPTTSLAPVEGTKKIELIASSFYRGFVHAALHSPDEHARLMLQLANGLRCWTLVRPKKARKLRQSAQSIAGLIEELL